MCALLFTKFIINLNLNIIYVMQEHIIKVWVLIEMDFKKFNKHTQDEYILCKSNMIRKEIEK